MFAYLSGKVVTAKPGMIILKTTAGTGFAITVDPTKNYMINENLELFILSISKENTIDFYGFNTYDERHWTEKLMQVPGVGPKMAANIVFSLSIHQISEALQKSDPKTFSQIKGLGAKTANKIIVELQGSMVDFSKLDGKTVKHDEFASEFVDTLSGLGYKRGEIVSAISQLKRQNLWNDNDLVETVRSGLRVLGRG
jgi:Holliday junction DNA helicase RuvA